MTPQQILDETKEKYSEYLEMNDTPYELISNILAIRVSSLESYVRFLERCLYPKNKGEVCINR